MDHRERCCKRGCFNTRADAKHLRALIGINGMRWQIIRRGRRARCAVVDGWYENDARYARRPGQVEECGVGGDGWCSGVVDLGCVMRATPWKH